MIVKSNSFITISVISNIVFEPYFNTLIEQCFTEYDTKTYAILYGEHTEYEYQNKLSESNKIIVSLDFESLLDEYDFSIEIEEFEKYEIDRIVRICSCLIDDITKISNAPILWLLFEDYFTKISVATGNIYFPLVDKINIELVKQFSNRISFIDLKRLIAEVGIDNAYNLKDKYRWNSPYSKNLMESIVREIYKQHLIENGITKKCLVLDADNVLWGGILSEDGIENIRLGHGFGREYQDFQKFVLLLYYHGIILAICSKNDMSDVMNMFRNHSEMVLKEEHIACFQVNWDNKVDNILKISNKLNIGLESMVFIDDSDFEVQAVKQLLPEVTAIRYERGMINNSLSCFNLKKNVDISKLIQRNNTYKTNEQREQLKEKCRSFDEYLNTLEMEIDIHPILPAEYSRVSELTQRTNKCTNGIRYTVFEIQEKVASNKTMLFSVSAKDRFSNLGLVGAFEIKDNTLMLYSLSCRALGCKIEKYIIEYILDKHKINKIVFKSTNKNNMLEKLLKKSFPAALIILDDKQIV